MQRKSFSGMNCSIARALEEVGEWWSLLIVRECTQGARRFDEFQRELGIARNILTARLQRLTELGILERFELEERANTEGYRLTPKGEDLYPVVVALMQGVAEDGEDGRRVERVPPPERPDGGPAGDRTRPCGGP